MLSSNSATPLLIGGNGLFCQSYFAVSHPVPFPQHSVQTINPEEAELLLVATPASAKPMKAMTEDNKEVCKRSYLTQKTQALISP